MGISPVGYFGLLGTGSPSQRYGSVVTGAVDGNNLPAGLQGGTFFGTDVETSLMYVGLTDGTTDHRTNNGQRVLDSQLEMPNGPNGPWTFPANGIPQKLVDAPGKRLNDPLLAWVTRDDLFEDYLMYTPPGIGSHPVALKKLSFRWGGGVYLSRQLASWLKLPGHPVYATPRNPAGTSTTTEPQWTAVSQSPIQFLTANGSIDNRVR